VPGKPEVNSAFKSERLARALVASSLLLSPPGITTSVNKRSILPRLSRISKAVCALSASRTR